MAAADKPLKTFALVYRLEYEDDLGTVFYRAAEMHANPEPLLRKSLNHVIGDETGLPADERRKVYVESHQEVPDDPDVGLARALGVTEARSRSRARPR